VAIVLLSRKGQVWDSNNRGALIMRAGFARIDALGAGYGALGSMVGDPGRLPLASGAWE
jgi:hypothetical protein